MCTMDINYVFKPSLQKSKKLGMLGPGWHTAEGIPTGQVSLAH